MTSQKLIHMSTINSNTNENWQKNDNPLDVHLGSPSLLITKGIQARLDKVYKIVNFTNKSILDVGCGVGVFMKEFEKYSDDVTGTEVDERKVEIAKSNRLNAILVQGEKLPEEFTEKFDIIFSHEVLEHTTDDDLLLSEITRCLAQHGNVILFIPNKWFPFETHGIYIGKKYFFGNKLFFSWAPEFVRKIFVPHVKIYTKSGIEKKLLIAGLKIIHHEYISPGFDRFANVNSFTKFVSQIYNFLVTKTFFKVFGISHFIVAKKIYH